MAALQFLSFPTLLRVVIKIGNINSKSTCLREMLGLLPVGPSISFGTAYNGRKTTQQIVCCGIPVIVTKDSL